MNNNFFEPEFIPSQRHGMFLTNRMQARLLESFIHIGEQVGQAIGNKELGPSVQMCMEQMKKAETGALAPTLFLLHAELLHAATLNDADVSVDLLKSVLRQDWTISELSVRDYSLDALGARDFARYSACLQVDPTTPMLVAAPDQDVSKKMQQNIHEALELFALAATEHSAEVLAILSEIILARNTDPANDAFSGPSSFAAWGAIFLCADTPRTPLDLIQAIVHEVAHLVLFAEAVDGPLVENNINETYSSPLRTDQRPTDGIFHATYVSARMYIAMTALQDGTSKFSCELKDTVARMKAANKRAFKDGYSVVCENAQLTPLGRSLIERAERCINAEDPVG